VPVDFLLMTNQGLQTLRIKPGKRRKLDLINVSSK
jgi:hypothetical protein